MEKSPIWKYFPASDEGRTCIVCKAILKAADSSYKCSNLERHFIQAHSDSELYATYIREKEEWRRRNPQRTIAPKMRLNYERKRSGNEPGVVDAKVRRQQQVREAVRRHRERVKWLEADSKIVDLLTGVEKLCNELRFRVLDECRSVKETLAQPSLIFKLAALELEPNTQFEDLYPASMNDIQIWNVRELRLCLEWAKTFEAFFRLSDSDQLYLVRNFAWTFNILNSVFYSLDYGPNKIVYPNGAFIRRQPQESVRIPGCRSIYHRQMGEIMVPFRELQLDVAEFAAFKATLFFNPGASDMSPDLKTEIAKERQKYSDALFNLMTSKHGLQLGAQRYGALLLTASSIQNIIDQNDENMQLMMFFGHAWRINGFVKELCTK